MALEQRPSWCQVHFRLSKSNMSVGCCLVQARPGYEFGLLHRLPERQSKCEVEVDACVEDILNRQEVSNNQECLPVCP